MLGLLFPEWRLRRMIKRYARTLRGELVKSYGGGDHYTVAQMDTAIRKLGLPPNMARFAYAAFMTELEFYTATDAAPDGSYEELRALFIYWEPVALDTADFPAPPQVL